ESPASPDEVLPRPALRLVNRARGPAAERRARERRIHRVLVDPMAELVHRREQRSEVALVGVRRQADVPEPRLLRERMRRLVDSPLAVVEAEGLEDAAPGLVLAGHGKRAAERDVVARLPAVPLDQTDQLRL